MILDSDGSSTITRPKGLRFRLEDPSQLADDDVAKISFGMANS